MLTHSSLSVVLYMQTNVRSWRTSVRRTYAASTPLAVMSARPRVDLDQTDDVDDQHLEWLRRPWRRLLQLPHRRPLCLCPSEKNSAAAAPVKRVICYCCCVFMGFDFMYNSCYSFEEVYILRFFFEHTLYNDYISCTLLPVRSLYDYFEHSARFVLLQWRRIWADQTQ